MGVWTEGLGDDWTVRHWSRQTLDAKHYPYGVDQLHSLADKAQALMQRVIGFKPKSPWNSLDKSHSVRNLGEYEGDLNVDERLVADLITACRSVVAKLDLLAPIPPVLP